MASEIEITFHESAGLHRVRNFAEELSVELGELGNVPLEEADAAVTRIVVHGIRKRHLGNCERLIQQLLKKHHMAAEATTRRLD